MQRTIYMTTKAIKNPLGDGRHDRASWRSALEQSHIPAGFIFGVTEDGTISDHSVPKFEVAAKFAGDLRKLLLENCTLPLGHGEPAPEPEPATVEEAIAAFGGPEAVALGLCEALGIRPTDIKEVMAKVTAAAAPGPAPKGKAKRGTEART